MLYTCRSYVNCTPGFKPNADAKCPCNSTRLLVLPSFESVKPFRQTLLIMSEGRFFSYEEAMNIYIYMSRQFPRPMSLLPLPLTPGSTILTDIQNASACRVVELNRQIIPRNGKWTDERQGGGNGNTRKSKTRACRVPAGGGLLSPQFSSNHAPTP